MFIKQLSVFIENREGRLEEVLTVLKECNVNIVSLSLADTSEYGLLRLIVSNPKDGQRALKENGFSAMLTDVIAIKLAHTIGMLQELLGVICEAHINIEYMYALSAGNDGASIVLKASDLESAAEMLEQCGAKIMTEEEIWRMQ